MDMLGERVCDGFGDDLVVQLQPVSEPGYLAPDVVRRHSGDDGSDCSKGAEPVLRQMPPIVPIARPQRRSLGRPTGTVGGPEHEPIRVRRRPHR